MRILCVYGNPPPVTGSTIGALLTSVLNRGITRSRSPSISVSPSPFSPPPRCLKPSATPGSWSD